MGRATVSSGAEVFENYVLPSFCSETIHKYCIYFVEGVVLKSLVKVTFKKRRVMSSRILEIRHLFVWLLKYSKMVSFHIWLFKALNWCEQKQTEKYPDFVNLNCMDLFKEIKSSIYLLKIVQSAQNVRYAKKGFRQNQTICQPFDLQYTRC